MNEKNNVEAFVLAEKHRLLTVYNSSVFFFSNCMYM